MIRIPPPMAMVIGILIVLISHQYFPSASIRIPGQAVIGATALFVGIAIAVIAVGKFFDAKTTITPMEVDRATSLVTTGLYSYSRNPMYLGMGMVIAGVGIAMGALITIFAVFGFVWFINAQQIEAEETALTKIFGQDFTDYCARVRRWI